MGLKNNILKIAKKQTFSLLITSLICILAFIFVISVSPSHAHRSAGASWEGEITKDGIQDYSYPISTLLTEEGQQIDFSKHEASYSIPMKFTSSEKITGFFRLSADDPEMLNVFIAGHENNEEITIDDALTVYLRIELTDKAKNNPESERAYATVEWVQKEVKEEETSSEDELPETVEGEAESETIPEKKIFCRVNVPIGPDYSASDPEYEGDLEYCQSTYSKEIPFTVRAGEDSVTLKFDGKNFPKKTKYYSDGVLHYMIDGGVINLYPKQEVKIDLSSIPNLVNIKLTNRYNYYNLTKSVCPVYNIINKKFKGEFSPLIYNYKTLNTEIYYMYGDVAPAITFQKMKAENSENQDEAQTIVWEDCNDFETKADDQGYISIDAPEVKPGIYFMKVEWTEEGNTICSYGTQLYVNYVTQAETQTAEADATND